MTSLSKRNNFTSVTGPYCLIQNSRTSRPSLQLIGLVHMRLHRYMTMAQSNSKQSMMKHIHLWSMAISSNSTPSLSTKKISYSRFHRKGRWKCWINTLVFLLHFLLSHFSDLIYIKTKQKNNKKKGNKTETKKKGV